MAERASFFGALAPDPGALDRIARRLEPALAAALQRFTCDGVHLAIAGAAASPAIASGARAWIAGRMAGDALATWVREGADALNRLDGNFQLVLHDPAGSRWCIAADLAGAKPLFHAAAEGALVFGASALQVLRATGLPPVADARVAWRYLSRGALAGDSATLLRGVSALPRAHRLECEGRAPHEARVLAFPSLSSAQSCGSFDDCARALRDRLMDSLDTQAGAGAVAVSGSGGIDSSGLVGALRANTAREVHLYAYLQRPPAIDASWDERGWAEQVATRAGAVLHAVEMDGDEARAALSAVVRTQDFPFGSPVICAQARLFAAAAADGHRAILTGHGADLLFGGGDTHLAARLAGLVRRGRFVAAARMAPGAIAHSAAGPLRFLASTAARVAGRDGLERARDRHVPWADTAWFAARGAQRAAPREPAGASDGLHDLIARQLDASLGTTTLLYEDRNAAALGLESRTPYLTAALVQVSRACDPAYFASRGGGTKHVLRHALRDLVPREVLARRERIGFPVPVLPWLLEDAQWLRQRCEALRDLPFYAGPSAPGILAELRLGTLGAWRTAFRVWRWVVLLEWSRVHNVGFE